MAQHNVLHILVVWKSTGASLIGYNQDAPSRVQNVLEPLLTERDIADLRQNKRPIRRTQILQGRDINPAAEQLFKQV